MGDWHQQDHMQIICTSLQTDNHTSTSSLNFLQTGCSFCCQPTVSKSVHWQRLGVQQSKRRYTQKLKHVTRRVFTKTTHVVMVLPSVACVVIPPAQLYVLSFIEIRSAVSQPWRSKIALSNEFGYWLLLLSKLTIKLLHSCSLSNTSVELFLYVSKNHLEFTMQYMLQKQWWALKVP